HTENTEAYLLYTRGRYFSSNFWTADGFKKGIDHLNQAIALDPAYALAHAGLAATYYEASSVWLLPNDAMPKAKAAALKALELDEHLAEAHTALAQVLSLYEWNWDEAEKHYRRALELNPNFAQAHQYRGICLTHRGQIEAGTEEIKQAQRLDPLTPSTSLSLVLNYYAARRYEEAIAQCRKILDMKSDFYMAHSMLGLVYEQQGKWDEAIAEFNEARRMDPQQPFTLGYLGHAYSLAGRRDEAQKLLAEMKQIAAKGTYVDPVPVAFIYTGLGRKDEAFAELEKAYQERDENLVHYKDTPIFDSLRADPRFTDLMRRVGLAP
ncbi:MAG: tetratricopeptide repeat protein, partial [Acidobacteriota bacterium]